MNKQLRIVLSLLLSTSMVLAAAPVNVFQHFCGDELMSTSINESIDTCCPNDESLPSDDVTLKQNCCSSEWHVLDGSYSGTTTPVITTPVVPNLSIPASIDFGITLRMLEIPVSFNANAPPPLPLKGLSRLAQWQRFLL